VLCLKNTFKTFFATVTTAPQQQIFFNANDVHLGNGGAGIIRFGKRGIVERRL
jgi:hypothetical protein